MKTNLRWWGWGTLDRAFPAPLAELALRYLQREKGFTLTESPMRPHEELSMPEPRLGGAAHEALVEQVQLQATPLARLTHAYGKGYADLIRLRQGDFPHPPDAVAWPTRVEEVVGTLQAAETHEVAIIPFGGGTCSNGGVEPVPRHGGSVSLDMRGMNRLVSIDVEAGLATFEAGILGPDLEAILNSYGCTLPHFPHSFEYSTLGGWIATRATGQHAVSVGNIESLVRDVQVVLPTGIVTSTADDLGHRLRGLWFGSHGTLGVVTRATVRIQPQPVDRVYRTVMFPDWDTATRCLQDMMGHDVMPAILELADADAAEFDMALEVPDTEGFHRTRRRLIQWQYEDRAIAAGRACRLVLVFEGETDDLALQVAQTERLVVRSGGALVGRSGAQQWYRLRFLRPYLRDDLLDQSLAIDTFQTTTSWTHLTAVYSAMSRVLSTRLGQPSLIMGRISTACRESVLLSFTWICPQASEAELDRWMSLRQAASEAAASAGGTVDHHFGIPLEKAVIDTLEPAPLRDIHTGLKRSLDPRNILNPDKLGFESFDMNRAARRGSPAR